LNTREVFGIGDEISEGIDKIDRILAEIEIENAQKLAKFSEKIKQEIRIAKEEIEKGKVQSEQGRFSISNRHYDTARKLIESVIILENKTK